MTNLPACPQSRDGRRLNLSEVPQTCRVQGKPGHDGRPANACADTCFCPVSLVPGSQRQSTFAVATRRSLWRPASHRRCRRRCCRLVQASAFGSPRAFRTRARSTLAAPSAQRCDRGLGGTAMAFGGRRRIGAIVASEEGAVTAMALGGRRRNGYGFWRKAP